MSGLPVIDAGGLVGVDGTPLQGSGWTLLETFSFIQGPAVTLNNRPLTGGPSKGYPADPAQRTFNVGFVIIGEFDGITGDAYDNPFDGLVANCLQLRELVFDITDPVRVATWEYPRLSLTRTGQIQFDGSPPMGDGLTMTTIETQLSVVLPQGSLS